MFFCTYIPTARAVGGFSAARHAADPFFWPDRALGAPLGQLGPGYEASGLGYEVLELGYEVLELL